MTNRIDTLLQELRASAANTREIGDRFERLIAKYLTVDPEYKTRFSHVWLWQDWPDRKGQPDTGIDIVARERDSGGYCAVQCKFYEAGSTLTLEDLSTFFSTSGKQPFTSRLIVSTTDAWTKHAEQALVDQQIPVTRLRVQDLAESAVDWSKFQLKRLDTMRLKPQKKVRPHQDRAIHDVLLGLREQDRGKLIMACGTGKTFTSLKTVEQWMAQSERESATVLFLLPSIALVAQTLKEWTAEAAVPLHCLAVCSDTSVGKSRDDEDIYLHDLPFPATTDAARVGEALRKLRGQAGITVLFSTYHSIAVVSEAQKKHKAGQLDWIICDEAHRTTGVTMAGEEESHFVRVHDAKFLDAGLRLYMTATPRLYSDDSKAKAAEANAPLCSMDDEKLYGKELHRLGFGEAVSKGLLTDYKVMVLAVDEKFISKAFQAQLANDGELKLDDIVKITGCWNGLAKRLAETSEGIGSDTAPMRRAVAFSRSIKDSQRFAKLFEIVVEQYAASRRAEGFLECSVKHVDGHMNALQRGDKLDWLRADTGSASECRILSNARCLSEGVDVPTLDAVMFLNPRNSVIDVVQAVGRVMRRSEGKQYGYIILPVGIPSDVPPDEALKDNQRYKVIWQVLQALRAHDDRFDATVNKIELNKSKPPQIEIHVIGEAGGGDDGDGGRAEGGQPPKGSLTFNFPMLEEWREAIFAKIVMKCGNRQYWEKWAGDVSLIAERHVTRIKALLESADASHRKAFEGFLEGLRQNLNPSVSEQDAIEMLAQHLITKPVFDALFEGYPFTQNNPVSRAMQDMLDVLEDQALAKEQESLEDFYASVRLRAQNIDNAKGRQDVIIELYDKFFKTAFPKMAEKLGIVYTPVEVVDFILRSAEDVLRLEFGVGLTDKGVHILDPFTGTGTFLVRLIQSGLIDAADLPRKYEHELHANEIVLLAYYIAAINIEEAYHRTLREAGKQPGYHPFEGIVLADTFQMTEKSGSLSGGMFPENNKRAKRQKELDIRVIVGNPPYSAQQTSQNDNNRTLEYRELDTRIEKTYAHLSTAGLKKNVYDSYTRAIRWASDRIKDQGIIGFVTNNSFLTAGNMDGMRLALQSEFQRMYIYNLRGNQRTQGELSKSEGGKIFGSGSRAGITIGLFVKGSTRTDKKELWYSDIGGYLSRGQKLAELASNKSVQNLEWVTLCPNSAGDWLEQRNVAFGKFLPLGNKDQLGSGLFATYSIGVATNRDAWAYNFGQRALANNIQRAIEFHNSEVDRCGGIIKKRGHMPTQEKLALVDAIINNDKKSMSWTVNTKKDIAAGQKYSFDGTHIVYSTYRPFCKQALYFDRKLNERVLQIPRIFPTSAQRNVVIEVSGVGAVREFSALATDCIPNLHLLDTGQCFPLYWYEKAEKADKGTNKNIGLAFQEPEYIRHDAISDERLIEFQGRYGKKVTKEDIFWFVYGLLHCPEYRERYKADLKKMLPRIPWVMDFWGFSKAGRELGHWHLNYETIEPWPLEERVAGKLSLRVSYMKYAGKHREPDKSQIVYNSTLTLAEIPAEAHEYIVNGKSALDWIIERYCVSTDKDSGIVNDANAWCEEVGDPRYIVDLVKRMVRVSLETVRIVKELPQLEIVE